MGCIDLGVLRLEAEFQDIYMCFPQKAANFFSLSLHSTSQRKSHVKQAGVKTGVNVIGKEREHQFSSNESSIFLASFFNRNSVSQMVIPRIIEWQ